MNGAISAARALRAATFSGLNFATSAPKGFFLPFFAMYCSAVFMISSEFFSASAEVLPQAVIP